MFSALIFFEGIAVVENINVDINIINIDMGEEKHLTLQENVFCV